MEGYAYYNGKIGRCNDISIPLTDRLIYFGDAVYDVITGHSGKLFLVNDHIDRLFLGMAKLNMIPYFTKDDLLVLIHTLINVSAYKSYLIYISCSRGADERRHSYLDCSYVNLLITIKEFYPQLNSDALKLITVDDERYNYCNIKTVNLLPSVIASTKADILGCDEAVFVKNGIITECAHSNIFIIKDNVLITHPESSSILSGTIRKYLIKNAADYNVLVNERAFSVEEMFSADEIIVTSTTKLAKEASIINNIEVGGKNPALLSIIKNSLDHAYYNI